MYNCAFHVTCLLIAMPVFTFLGENGENETLFNEEDGDVSIL